MARAPVVDAPKAAQGFRIPWDSIAFVIGAGSLGALAARAPAIAPLLVGLAVFLLLWIKSPITVAVIAVPGVWLIARLGGDLISLTDVLLSAAALLALPALTRRDGPPVARAVSWGLAFYTSTLIISVVAHPSTGSLLAVIQRVLLVGGSVAVGVWLADNAKQRTAMRLLALVGLVFAVAAIWESFTQGFVPAYPFGWHKNFAGSILAATFMVVFAAGSECGIRAAVRYPLLVTLALGVLGCRSRGAALGLALGMFVWFFTTQSRQRRKQWWLAVIAAAGFALFTALSVQDQLSDEATMTSNSIATRQDVAEASMDLWRSAPVTGVGVRYWESGRFTERAQLFAPINAVQGELAESGVVGATGWITLHGLALIALARRRGPWAVAGLAVLAGKILHGMTDIYWGAGTITLAWIVVGIGLAASQPRSSPEIVDVPVRPQLVSR